MEIRAKLSLAVDGFKSGLDSAKKGLDSFGKEGSKLNSKFAKDIRTSFDNLGPNLKREGRGIRREFDGIGKDIKASVRGSLNGMWTPMQKGFTKAAAKMRVEGAIIGSIFKTMNGDARAHYSKLDGFINKNFENSINSSNRVRATQMQNLTAFEKKMSSSNRRMAREAMMAQYGARPSTSGSIEGLPTKKSVAASPASQFDRIKLKSFTPPAEEALSFKKRAQLYKADAKELAAATAYKAKYEAVYQMGRLKRAVQAQKAEAAAAWSGAKNSVAAAAYRAKYEAVYAAGRMKRFAEERKAASGKAFATEVKFLGSEEFMRTAAATRYALYDVGQRFIAFGAVVVSSLAQAVKASANMESSFTSVERTVGLTLGKSGGAAEELRNKLIELSTTIPVSFDQIAKIATLGAQMGISSDAVDNFAETVSKFSAITGISAETAAQSFGRLGQLLGITASEFENLSSAITFTGVNSVATDQEILSMSESIAAAGKQAGMSADEVIGMSAALASLKIRPEEARGVLARLFREIDVQVSTAGSGLTDFAQTLGITTESATALWKQDPSAFFTKFLDGAQATGKLNQTLVALGITNTREMNVIQRLSQNTDLLAKTMGDAEDQFLMGTYSTEAYGLVVDDINSKVTIFQSTLTKMQAAFGDTLAGGVGKALDALTFLANLLGNLPTGIKGTIAVIAALGAIAAIFFGSLAVGIAGLLAMKLAMRNLTKEVGTSGISLRTFNALLTTMIPTTGRAAAGLKMLGISATTSAAGVNTLKISMKSLMISTGIGIAIVALTTALDHFGSAAGKAKDASLAAGKAMMEAGGGSDAFAKAIAADQKAIEDGATALGYLTVAYDENTAAKLQSENTALATGKGAKAAVEAFSEELDATGQLTTAIDGAKDAQEEYNKVKFEGLGISKDTTLALGAETAKLFIAGLSAYKGVDGDQATFWEEYLSPDNASIKAEAEALGFNFGQFAAAALKDDDGGAAYIAGLKAKADELQNLLLNVRNKGTDATNQVIQSYGEKANWSQAAIDALKASVQETGVLDPAGLVGDSPEMFTNLIAGADGFRDAMKQNEAVITANKDALIAMGYEADAAAGISGGLSEELTGYMNAAFAGEQATNKATDALGSYLDGVNDTKDGLAGARQDSANWISFMEAAQNAAVQNGEGFAGSVKRITAGIGALKKAGKSTKEPFEKMRAYMVNAAKGEGFTTLAAKIATATSPEEMTAFIQAWTQVGTETGKAKNEVMNYGNALVGALTVTDEEIADAAAGIDKVTTSAGQAKTALEIMGEALEKAFKGITNKMAVQDAIDNLKSSLASAGKSFNVFTESGRENLGNLQGVIESLRDSSNGNEQTFANDLASLRRAMVKAGITSTAALGLIDTALRTTGKTGKASTAQINSFFNNLTQAAKKETTKTKRTLKDWASDVQTVLNDAFSNRYDATSSLDKITSAWDDMKDAAAAAAEKIQEAKETIATLTADRSVLEYQLRIAIKYGDTVREATLRAAIAEKTANITAETKKQTDAQEEASTALTGNSDAAIKNRQKMRDMVQGYNDYLLSLARTGTSNEELNKKAKELAAEFLTQGKNMGFAEADLKSYTEAFEGDFATVIKNIPKDVTLTLNSTDPVITAIAEFVTKANAELGKIEVIDLSGNVITGTDTGAQTDNSGLIVKKPTQAEIDGYRWAKRVILNKNLPAATRTMAFKRVREFKAMYGTGYKDGGLVLGPGSGTSDSIPAMLSNREFVVNATAVKHYGTDFMNALNQMRVSRPYASGSAAGNAQSGSGVVYLSPEDRQLLRAAIDRPIALYTENQKIAQSANAGNVLLAQRGNQ